MKSVALPQTLTTNNIANIMNGYQITQSNAPGKSSNTRNGILQQKGKLNNKTFVNSNSTPTNSRNTHQQTSTTQNYLVNPSIESQISSIPTHLQNQRIKIKEETTVNCINSNKKTNQNSNSCTFNTSANNCPSQAFTVFNQRYQNVLQFPNYRQRKNGAFERRLRRCGLELDSNNTICELRKFLQPYILRDFNQLIDKYIETYFMKAFTNIRENVNCSADSNEWSQSLKCSISKTIYEKMCCEYQQDPYSSETIATEDFIYFPKQTNSSTAAQSTIHSGKSQARREMPKLTLYSPPIKPLCHHTDEYVSDLGSDISNYTVLSENNQTDSDNSTNQSQPQNISLSNNLKISTLPCRKRKILYYKNEDDEDSATNSPHYVTKRKLSVNGHNQIKNMSSTYDESNIDSHTPQTAPFSTDNSCLFSLSKHHNKMSIINTSTSQSNNYLNHNNLSSASSSMSSISTSSLSKSNSLPN